MLSNLVNTLGAILPVFMLIGLGAALKRFDFIDEIFTGRINKLVFYVAAPALLFRSLFHADISRAFNFQVILAALVITIFIASVPYLVAGLFRVAPERRGTFVQGCFRSNLVFIGLPVLLGAYGDQALAPASMIIGFLTPVYNMTAVVVLIMPHHNIDRGPVLKPVAWEIVTNPLAISCILGVLGGLASLQMPYFMDQSVKLTGQIALPLALIAVGGSLDFKRLGRNLTLTVVTSMIKLVLLPAALLLTLLLLDANGLALKAGVVLLASPTAVASYIMAHQMKGDGDLAAAIITGSTLFSIITMTGWLLVLSLI